MLLKGNKNDSQLVRGIRCSVSNVKANEKKGFSTHFGSHGDFQRHDKYKVPMMCGEGANPF